MQKQVAGGVELEGQGGELRTQAVVQVAPQAAPFLFARVYQPLTRTLQVGGEAHGVSGSLGVAGEVVEQALIFRPERLARGARGEYQLTDGPKVDITYRFGPPAAESTEACVSGKQNNTLF